LTDAPPPETTARPAGEAGPLKPWRIALIYLVAGGAWILITDWLFSRWGGAGAIPALPSMVKGLLFVAGSALIIGLLTSWHARRQANLRAREHMLAAIVRNLDESVVATDLRGRVIYWSPAAERLYGWPADEAMGKSVSELIVPHDPEREAARIETALREGAWRGSYPQRRQDGTLFWARTTLSRLDDEAGRPMGVVGMDIDVTERYQLDVELFERIKELTALHQAASLLQREKRSETEVLEALAELIPPAFQAPEETAARVSLGDRALTTPGFQETPHRLAVDFRVNDGRAGRIEVFRQQPQADPQALAWPDDTPFLEEESRLLRTLSEMLSAWVNQTHFRRALTASEARYRQLVETMPAAVFLLEHEIIRQANHAAAEMLGAANAEALVGTEWHTWHPAADPNATLPVKAARAPGEAILRDTLLLHRRDGGRRVRVDARARRFGQPDESTVLITCLDITEQHRIAGQIENQEQFSALTGLPNRTAITQQLARMVLEPACQPGVIFVDLDDFKHVNDSLGHAAGDQLLAEVAGRLGTVATEQELIIGHWSGDKFVLLGTGLPQAELERTAAAVVNLAREPFFSPMGAPVYLGISVGLASAETEPESEEVLIRNAEAAMYEAKQRGKNGWAHFEPWMTQRADQKVILHAGIREAIASQSFEAHYQPIIACHDGRPCGLEALARWRSDRDPVPPDVFVPVAEATGLVLEIDLQICHLATLAMSRWLARWPEADWSVSVNASARSLMDPTYPGRVAACLEQSELDEKRLTIELTETVLMNRSETVVHNLHALDGMGVGLVIDDFGSGYSSLGYLNELPAVRLKIDRTFIAGLPGTEGIVRAAIALARSLEMTVTAEGVEDLETAAHLKALGCHTLQGFGLGRPMPEEAAGAWLEEHGRASLLN